MPHVRNGSLSPGYRGKQPDRVGGLKGMIAFDIAPVHREPQAPFRAGHCGKIRMAIGKNINKHRYCSATIRQINILR